MPLRTKLHTHIFADNEHWSWQKFAVKRDKSVQFKGEGGRAKEREREKKSEATSGPGAFCRWAFLFCDLPRNRRVRNDTAAWCFTRRVRGAFAGDLIFFFSFAVRLLAVRAAKCFISRPWLVDKETARPKRHDPCRFIYAAFCARPPHSSGRLRTGAGDWSIAPQLLPPPSHRRRRRKVGHLFFARNWLSWVSQGFAVIISSRYSRAQHGGSSIPNPPPPSAKLHISPPSLLDGLRPCIMHKVWSRCALKIPRVDWK